MASEIGLLKSFAVYNFSEFDERQMLSYVVEQQRIRDLQPSDENEIFGFDAPVFEYPDQLCFKVGQRGYLLKIMERKHHYGKRLKFETKKLLEPMIRERRSELEEGEELSKNMRKKLHKEAKEEAKVQMRKNGITDVQEKEIPVLIMKDEKLAFISIDDEYKHYEKIASMLKLSGISGLQRLAMNAGSVRNAMTEVLKHQGLVSKIDAGKDREGEPMRVSLGESVRLTQQNAAENQAPETIQARHFGLNDMRSEISEHINSEQQKMSESLEFYLTNSQNKVYHATLSVDSFFSGVGYIKQPGAIEEESDEYIIDTAVRATGVMISLKNLLTSLEGLSA